MSVAYTPGGLPDEAEQLTAALRNEFQAIKRGLESAAPLHELQILYAAPARTRKGMIVYADGASWNPGFGEGVYRRNILNTAWVYLG